MRRSTSAIIAVLATIAIGNAPAMAQHDHMGGGTATGHMDGPMAGMHSEEMMQHMNSMMDRMTEMMQEMHATGAQADGMMGDQTGAHHEEHLSAMQQMSHDMDDMMPLMNSMLENMRGMMAGGSAMDDPAMSGHLDNLMLHMNAMIGACQETMTSLQQMHAAQGAAGGQHPAHDK